MEKKIKKYGDSNIINLTKDEMEINELKTGDIIEIKISKIEKTKKKK